MLEVSPVNRAIRACNGRSDGHPLFKGHRPRFGHRSENVNLASGSRWQVNEIVRFEVNILREVSGTDQALKIDGQHLAVSQDEAATQVGQFITGAKCLRLAERGEV